MSILSDIKRQKGGFIIAEAGVNYYDIAADRGIPLMDAAKLMIEEAGKAGAHAVKFQSYKAEKIASKNSPAYWDRDKEPTASQYELFSKFDKFGEDEYRELAAFAAAQAIIFASTPFDFEAADFLEPLMPFYKISSSDLTNLPFIEHMAKKGKPVLLSTGAATLEEIQMAVDTIKAFGSGEICLLHCILSYPTADHDANLNMIRYLGENFPDALLGFSDHVPPDESMLVPTVAYILGAKIIEKHFTLNKSLPGNDHYHAMDPFDLRKLKDNIELVDRISGKTVKEPLECERESRKQARRSIVAARHIGAGEVISLENVTFKRPGTGISPRDFDKVQGRKAKRSIPGDQLLNWEDI